jgi:UPF0042 nucleotide-binding protein
VWITLPPDLLPKFAELCLQGKVNKVALGIDIRGGGFFEHILERLKALERMGLKYRIIFLQASDETLIRRYKETRRRHPLAKEGRVLEGISRRAETDAGTTKPGHLCYRYH